MEPLVLAIITVFVVGVVGCVCIIFFPVRCPDEEQAAAPAGPEIMNY